MNPALVLLLAVSFAEAQTPVEDVRFKTPDGWTLAASYRKPAKGKPVAVLIHGVAAGKGEWDAFAAELWTRGYGTLAIDLRGHGDSIQGPSGTSDFHSFDRTGDWPRAQADLEAALAYLQTRGLKRRRVGLIGASIGANLASKVEAPWLILLSPGRDYRGVTLADPRGRKALVCASKTDAYAYETTRASSGKTLYAENGHGVQMFSDGEFLKGLLAWLEANAR
ncbi:MAG: alpha/beta fold hydrolase [Elusimicrobiota bacterium]